ncbi:1-(5-phosphoribosyl)-5-[(5-phosphoribosylamino)methylideneamino]imidazole-4-carboxamide isomerase [Leptospira sp. GIMC2001]|uniref:1-(5-phosphoribosyl)-5-[(5- phosphoribosylamino)methylideneamino]imidazole-4- carboxamide isomerase n=1 Tax=Leptospira sp. GIMC2001 TaxID=1513297 RepID=UPI0023494A69|nr:1-(5-phosphoribosyl)-5-[(5-phosphoribosylamino)methylideneamino]imidazole-4-carboxamide isomerase [Leptospira sp. GIMC2001]WCL48620.1 1-(5-phosphoribosyl)-5-[(5-phosphoribosylamino)methylideneamino]imidazole-4-carboxamide isomerase [Leptospira sp. GIMC2001]
MIVIPAIDLLENQAVRLYQGDYQKKTIYSDAPWNLVADFTSQGAELIHLVDLDGAKLGKPGNETAIRKIQENSKVKLELGGGIRNLDTLKFYDNLGIDRFILGTSAVIDPKLVDDALVLYGVDRIVVGVDAKDGFVKTQGWEKDVGLRFEDFMERIHIQGVRHVIFTDISLDGTLQGPNFYSYEWILSKYPFQLIASGGVSSIEDLEVLSKIGSGEMYGAITGKAIYEGKIDLRAAVDFCKKT